MPDRIEREILLPSTPAQVWEAITDPDALSTWFVDDVLQLELFTGGEAAFVIGSEYRSGWIEEISPPEEDPVPGTAAGRLAFWWSTDEEPASRVELTVIPLHGGGTRLRVIETRPLELLDLVGIPLPGRLGRSFGPALVAG